MRNEIHYGDIPFRPDMAGVILKGRRGKLFSIFYSAAGGDKHPAVLLFHGIPGNEKNMDIAQDLRREGFHVFMIHYSGSWGSEGDYSLSSCVEDAETALDFLLDTNRWPIDKERIYAVGHSLGGFVASYLSSKRDEIKATCLLMPCDIGNLYYLMERKDGSEKSIVDVLNESSLWLTGTSGKKLIFEAIEKKDQFRFVSLAGKLAKKPLLCVSGSLDTCTPYADNVKPLVDKVKSLNGSVTFELYNTDHLFSDYRETVSKKIIAFLLTL